MMMADEPQLPPHKPPPRNADDALTRNASAESPAGRLSRALTPMFSALYGGLRSLSSPRSSPHSSPTSAASSSVASLQSEHDTDASRGPNPWRRSGPLRSHHARARGRTRGGGGPPARRKPGSRAAHAADAAEYDSDAAAGEEVTEIWLNVIFPQWEALKDSSLTQRLWVKGIPAKLRGEAWAMAVGNELNITVDVYNTYRERALKTQQVLGIKGPALLDSALRSKIQLTSPCSLQVDDGSSESLSSQKTALQRLSISDSTEKKSKRQSSFALLGYEDSVELVFNDISRTFPHLGLFQTEGPMAPQFVSVLQAFACYRSDIGYVQGMSYLAAMLLLNMDDFCAFKVICNMFRDNFGVLTTFYSVDKPRIEAHYRIFAILLEKHAPDVHQHLIDIDVKPEFFLYEWFLSIFSKSLHIDVAHKVWDLFFMHGDVVLFRTALTLLKLYETRLCGLGFEECITDVLRLPARIVERNDTDSFWRCYYKFTSVNKPTYQELRIVCGVNR